MKIVQIRATALKSKVKGSHDTSTRSFPSRESCLVEISTDEGIVGIGDSQRPESPEAVCYFIRDVFSPLLLGSDPSQIERLWSSLYHLLRIRGRTKGIAVEALSAVDIALWDIVGKARGAQVCDLIGGKCRDSLEAYATEVMYGKSIDGRLADAEEYVNKGFKAFKVAAGKDVTEDVKFVRALRDKFGYTVRIALDANCALSLKRALESFSKFGEVRNHVAGRTTPS